MRCVKRTKALTCESLANILREYNRSQVFIGSQDYPICSRIATVTDSHSGTNYSQASHKISGINYLRHLSASM